MPTAFGDCPNLGERGILRSTELQRAGMPDPGYWGSARLSKPSSLSPPISPTNLLHYPIRGLDGALHPTVPPRRVLTGEEDPTFPLGVYRYRAELARAERCKPTLLP